MEKEQRLELYKEAVDYWGEIAQYDQCIEEMAELTIAINKMKRHSLYNETQLKNTYSNLIEEIADVQMCIEQLKMMLGEKQIEEMFDIKLNKLKNLLITMKGKK